MSKTWGQSGTRFDRGEHKRGNKLSNGKGIRLVVSRYYDPLTKTIRFMKAYVYKQLLPNGLCMV